MTKFVFISLESCAFFQIYGPPPKEWFSSFSSELIPLLLYKSNAGDVLILTPNEISNIGGAGFTVLVADDDGLFPEIKNGRKPEAFNRILRLVQTVVDYSISIPALWKPYNAGSFITIQSNPRASGVRTRLLFDRRSSANLFGLCYGAIAEEFDLQNMPVELIDLDLVEAHLRAIKQESLEKGLGRAQADSFDLEVTNKVLGLGDSLQTWYESKLTTTQRVFTDFALTKSVRVRGPAGSGKTIAMVVKLLRQFEADKKLQKNNRYAFLTHSEATVDLVRSMLRTMVSEQELAALTEQGNRLYLGTLYSLAFETLGTELRGVSPLSLDGRAGREMQLELLNSVFRVYFDTNWPGRKGGCTDDFVSRMNEAHTNEVVCASFLLEVLTEFACVIEPEGIARSAQKREEYAAKSSREPWRLRLSTSDERRVILDLHAEFRREMRETESISVDQLIADFDRFLDSNAWDLTRATSGFDAIFVDELHLLNRMERMLITSLQKNPEAKPIVVMAEDVKQDIRRVGNGLKSWQNQFDGLENFNLDEVFRYTPQINEFLRVIDEFAPTLNLDEDWPNYMQRSQLPPGPKPDARILSNVREQYDTIFPGASIAAKRRKNGRTVAVLTCDYANFKQYLKAGEHRDLFIPVESREDITSIPNRGTKFVLSMPEFVAGLQFDEVFLIDVSVSVLAGGEVVGARDKRRGLSTVYLGSSRAMKILHISSLKDAGGLPVFVEHAVTTDVCTRI